MNAAFISRADIGSGIAVRRGRELDALERARSLALTCRRTAATAAGIHVGARRAPSPIGTRSADRPTSGVGTASLTRKLVPWLIPLAVTTGWLAFVTTSGHWPRVEHHFRSSITMIVGSFVAGSTPQGGGAVAFPVFTKAMEIQPPVARTFSLSIQAFGMSSAALVILLQRRHIEAKAVMAGSVAGVTGFVAALFLLGSRETPFWSPTIPAPYVKVTFSVVVAAMSYSIYLALRNDRIPRRRIANWNARTCVGISAAGVLGGVASALTGSGADVCLFLFVVVMAGLSTKVGVPTSVITMAIVSVVGCLILGVAHGQLSTHVVDGQVVAVGGSPVTPLPASQFDLFGLWIAAVPVVVWGAPLGAVFAASVSENRLIAFVTVMALLEVISTAVFLDELHSDRALVVYSVAMLTAALVAVRYLMKHGYRLLRHDRHPEPEPVPVPRVAA